jgi:hypothetical protein
MDCRRREGQTDLLACCQGQLQVIGLAVLPDAFQRPGVRICVLISIQK